MSHQKLRFAICGAGKFGIVFARYLSEVAGVVAIADPDSETRKRFCQETGLDVAEFENHEQLLAKADVDAIAVTSPNYTHKEITVAAARAGKHVFCEKAMANTVEDCWEMVRECEVNHVRLMVGHKRRLRPPWARMIELRAQLGGVVGVSSSLYYDARPYDHQGWWTKHDRCGGLLSIAGVHTLDWMRAMCGDAKSVRAVAGPRLDSRYDFSDTMHTLIEFRSGAVATLNVSLAYPLQKFRESVGSQVVCAAGGMRLTTALDHITLCWQHRSAAHGQTERFLDLGFDHAYRLEVGDFVRWIEQGTTPCLTWEEGLRCVELMEAAYRSAAAGGSVVELPLCPEIEQARASNGGNRQ